MKKYISVVLSLILLISVFSIIPVSAVTEQKPQNYYEGGDFEFAPTGKYFYWGFDAWHGGNFSGDGASWMVGSVTDELSYSGGKSLKCSTVAWWNVFNTVQVEKNTDYTYVFYMYVPEGADDGEGYRGLRYITVSDPERYISSSGANMKAFYTEYYEGDQYAPSSVTKKANVYGEWKRYEVKFNSGDFTAVKIGVCFAGMASGYNYCYIDDIGLYKETDLETYSYNKFQNGSLANTEDFEADEWSFSLENFKGKANNKAASFSVVQDTSLSSLKTNTNAVKIDVKTGANFLMWTANTYALKENTEYNVEFLVKTNNLTRLKAYIYEPSYIDRLNQPNATEWPYEGQNIYSYKYNGGEDSKNSPYRKTRVARSDLSFTWKANETTLSNDGSSMVQTAANKDPSETYANGGWVTVSATFKTGSGSWNYDEAGKGAENLNYAANVALGIGCVDQLSDGSISVAGFSLKEACNFEDNVAAGFEYVGAAVRIRGVPALRFKTRINREIISYFYPDYEIKEVGALTLKTQYLNGGKLSFDSIYKYGGVNRSAKSAKLWDENYNFPEDEIFSLVLTNIMGKDYTSDYSYRPYVKLTKGKEELIIYGEEYSASLSDVAMLAVNAKKASGGFLESEECRNLVWERFLSNLTPTELSVLNNQPYINTDFFGANWAVYHGTTYMKDKTGRNYTEEMAQKEFNRLVDSGITGVRTIFRSTWMHPIEMTFTGWDFENETMQAFYKWAKEMQKRDIDIIITAGWLLTWYAREEYTENLWYDEVPYLHGDGEDYYGESNGVDFSGMTENEIRLKKASLRYGEWVRRCLEAFKANGINNVKYVLCFTEPSGQKPANSTTGTPSTKLGVESVEYVTMVKGLHEVLTKHGVRDTVKIIGPNQATGLNAEDMILMEYCLKELKGTGVIDIYTAHSYPSTANIHGSDYFIPEVSWNYHNYIMKEYNSVMERQNFTGTFLYDEMTGGGEATDPKISAYFGIQAIVGAINIMHNGADGIMRWNIFDQLWPNSDSNTGEFREGIHVTGLAPSFFESYVPRNQYYSFSLFTKYIKGLNKVVNCNGSKVSDSLYYIVLEDDNGNLTAVVVNTSQSAKYFNLKFNSSLNNLVLNRHMFEYTSSNPNSEAKLAGIDKIIRVNNEIKDVIPAGGLMIYTTRKD